MPEPPDQQCFTKGGIESQRLVETIARFLILGLMMPRQATEEPPLWIFRNGLEFLVAQRESFVGADHVALIDPSPTQPDAILVGLSNDRWKGQQASVNGFALVVDKGRARLE